MKFYKVKVISEGVYHHNCDGVYTAAPIGTIVTVGAPEESTTEALILSYANGCMYSSLYSFTDFEILDTYTDKPLTVTKEIEVIKEVPIETTKVVSLKEVLGQDISSINFN